MEDLQQHLDDADKKSSHAPLYAFGAAPKGTAINSIQSNSVNLGFSSAPAAAGVSGFGSFVGASARVGVEEEIRTVTGESSVRQSEHKKKRRHRLASDKSRNRSEYKTINDTPSPRRPKRTRSRSRSRSKTPKSRKPDRNRKRDRVREREKRGLLNVKRSRGEENENFSDEGRRKTSKRERLVGAGDEGRNLSTRYRSRRKWREQSLSASSSTDTDSSEAAVISDVNGKAKKSASSCKLYTHQPVSSSSHREAQRSTRVRSKTAKNKREKHVRAESKIYRRDTDGKGDVDTYIGGVAAHEVYKRDRQGDRENELFGKPYQGDVPSYNRSFKGLILGSGGRGGREEGKRRRPCMRYYEIQSSLDNVIENIVVPVSEESDERNAMIAVDDFIPLLGTITVSEETDTVENQKMKKDAANEAQRLELSRIVRENPHNISAWMQMVDFQAESLKKKHTKGMVKVVKERQLDILEKALHLNQNDEELILRRLSAARELLETSELAGLWRTAMFRFSASPAIWNGYLDMRETHFSSYTFSQMCSTWERCLATLAGVRDGTVGVYAHMGRVAKVHGANEPDPELVNLICRYFRHMWMAGHTEKAIGVVQALVEYNSYERRDVSEGVQTSDSTRADTNTNMNTYTQEHKKKGLREPVQSKEFFEPFWDAEVPRFGEVGARGWSAYVHSKNDNEHAVEFSKSKSIKCSNTTADLSVGESVDGNSDKNVDVDGVGNISDRDKWLWWEVNREIGEALPWHEGVAHNYAPVHLGVSGFATVVGDESVNGAGVGSGQDLPDDADRIVLGQDVIEAVVRLPCPDDVLTLIKETLRMMGMTLPTSTESSWTLHNHLRQRSDLAFLLTPLSIEMAHLYRTNGAAETMGMSVSGGESIRAMELQTDSGVNLNEYVCNTNEEFSPRQVCPWYWNSTYDLGTKATLSGGREKGREWGQNIQLRNEVELDLLYGYNYRYSSVVGHRSANGIGREILRQAIQLFPNDEELLIANVTMIADDGGPPPESSGLKLQSECGVKQGIKYCKELLQQPGCGENYRLWYMYGQLELKAGNKKSARKVYDRILAVKKLSVPRATVSMDAGMGVRVGTDLNEGIESEVWGIWLIVRGRAELEIRQGRVYAALCVLVDYVMDRTVSTKHASSQVSETQTQTPCASQSRTHPSSLESNALPASKLAAAKRVYANIFDVLTSVSYDQTVYRLSMQSQTTANSYPQSQSRHTQAQSTANRSACTHPVNGPSFVHFIACYALLEYLSSSYTPTDDSTTPQTFLISSITSTPTEADAKRTSSASVHEGYMLSVPLLARVEAIYTRALEWAIGEGAYISAMYRAKSLGDLCPHRSTPTHVDIAANSNAKTLTSTYFDVETPVQSNTNDSSYPSQICTLREPHAPWKFTSPPVFGAECLLQNFVDLISTHVDKHPESCSRLRGVIETAILLFPGSTYFLSRYILFEARFGLLGRPRRFFNNLLNEYSSVELPITTWLFSIHAECVARVPVQNRIISLLDRAVNNPFARTAACIWHLYLRVVAGKRIDLPSHPLLRGDKQDDVMLVMATRHVQKNDANYNKKVESIFYRSLEACPGVKSLYIEAIASFADSTDVWQVAVDLMQEKELRVRTPLEELELL
eukprot:CFRG5007T1